MWEWLTGYLGSLVRREVEVAARQGPRAAAPAPAPGVLYIEQANLIQRGVEEIIEIGYRSDKEKLLQNFVDLADSSIKNCLAEIDRMKAENKSDAEKAFAQSSKKTWEQAKDGFQSLLNIEHGKLKNKIIRAAESAWKSIQALVVAGAEMTWNAFRATARKIIELVGTVIGPAGKAINQAWKGLKFVGKAAIKAAKSFYKHVIQPVARALQTLGLSIQNGAGRIADRMGLEWDNLKTSVKERYHGAVVGFAATRAAFYERHLKKAEATVAKKTEETLPRIKIDQVVRGLERLESIKEPRDMVSVLNSLKGSVEVAVSDLIKKKQLLEGEQAQLKGTYGMLQSKLSEKTITGSETKELARITARADVISAELKKKEKRLEDMEGIRGKLEELVAQAEKQGTTKAEMNAAIAPVKARAESIQKEIAEKRAVRKGEEKSGRGGRQ